MPWWKGYRAGSQSAEPSSGAMQINYHGARVTAGQQRAVERAVVSAPRMQATILEAIVQAYPAKATRSSLKKLIEPWELLVMKESHEGLAYVAWGFSCAWDPSGFYVMTHAERIVAVGDFDVLTYPIADPQRAPRTIRSATPAQRTAARERARTAARKNPPRLASREELQITLPVWAGFSSRPGEKVAKGSILVSVGEDGDDVTAAQQRAYRALIKEARATQTVLLDAIVASYPEARRRFDGFFMAMPEQVNRKSLEDLISLTSVCIHDVERGGLAYVGFSFSCAWEREHGLGVMTLGRRIVKLGGADTAILGWIAARDRDA
ncbi:MAG: hypothetical protein QM817_30550 [Archangium sp.]